MALDIACLEPDIPQNLGAILRLCACFGAETHVIEPCGFVFSDARIRRSGMDYVEHVALRTHPDWHAFLDFAQGAGRRVVLLTTRGDTAHHRFSFRDGDILLLGRESAGAPPHVHDAADACLRIPMREGLRSMNVAVSAGIVLAEALRQTGALDTLT